MSVEAFAHPEWLTPVGAALALLLASLAFASVLAGRRVRRLLGPGARQSARSLRTDAVLAVAGLSLGLALLGPRIGERVLRVPASGVDVVFLVDVSRSMDASDVPPSRLARSRRAVEELLARLDPADRVALAAFSGRGVLFTPLTPDFEAVRELLSGLDTELLRPSGSDLGAGVRAAIDAFEAGSERPRVAFVLSDGEDAQRSGDVGVADALRSDVRVLAAGLGSERGATLDDHGTPLADRFGRTVVSRRDLGRLERLALPTGGDVLAADDWGGFDFDAAAAAIRRDTGGASGGFVERRVRAVQVAPLAALAFLCLLFDGLPRPRRRATTPMRPVPATIVLALALAAPANGQVPSLREASLPELEAAVRDSPGDPALLVALGAARLERGQREDAARAFRAAALSAREPRSAAIAYFDLGVVALEDGDFVAAREAFFDALSLAPDDARTLFNLEWTLVALADRPPPPETPEPPPPPVPEPPSGVGDERSTAPEPEIPEPLPPAPSPELTEERRERWLDRIEDDPSHALRAVLRDDAGEPRRARSGGPAW